MRTMHLIESAHTGHSTTGMHSFLSISVHVAVVLTALYATTRPVVQQEPLPDRRVYFTPEPRPATVAAAAPAPRPVPPKAAPAPPNVQVPVVIPPAGLPPVDVPLAGPPGIAPENPVMDGEPGVTVVAPGSTGGTARTGPYEAGEVEVAAAPLTRGGPTYPDQAIRLGLSGAVTARFIVAADGRVESEVDILHSTSPQFTSAVRKFLRSARYRPARVGGRAVRQLVEQRFVFELTS